MKTAFIATMLVLFGLQFLIRAVRIFDERTEWPREQNKITLPQELGGALIDGLTLLWGAFALALST